RNSSLLACCIKDTGHANLLSNNTFHCILFIPSAPIGEIGVHIFFLRAYLLPSNLLSEVHQAFISTSTPLGKSSLLKASTVRLLLVYMSNKRLCVHNWNCSRAFLLTCGERNTVKIFL
ncbi:MAG TPA: hypothetical protein VK498_03115, partial [Ferruginibacter sp.]|nr:hypothetical protein [Ferruginibacter sp.]